MEGDTQISPDSIVVNLQAKETAPFGGPGSGITSADGTFTISNVPPNTYRVMTGVRGGQAAYLKSVLLGEQELAERELTVGDGAPPALTLVLSTAMAKVSGQVIAEGANQGATVVLIPADLQRTDLYRSATSDQYGKFSLGSIAPGEYTVYAWDDVEPGAWQDAEFLSKFENKGKKIALKENESVTVDAVVLKVEATQ
jgi:hypothetical protein